MKIILGLLATLCCFFLLCSCIVAGRCSKWEDEFENEK